MSFPAANGSKNKALLLVLVLLLLRPFGNLSLAYGMRHTLTVLSASPVPYLAAMLNPFVAVGILMLIGSLLVRMALLSVADLSYVLPLTATGYVISVMLGWIFLKEQVSSAHWLGTLLVFAGASFVGSTNADTTDDQAANSTDRHS